MQAKFKVGDKVVVTQQHMDCEELRGRQGTVVEIEFYPHIAEGYYNFSVQFPSWTGGVFAPDIWWFEDDGSVALVPTPTVASDLRCTPGARRVLDYLKRNGDISPLEAMTVLGVGRLASCIHELRSKAGYSITTEVREDDVGHRYGRYFLKQPALVN